MVIASPSLPGLPVCSSCEPFPAGSACRNTFLVTALVKLLSYLSTSEVLIQHTRVSELVHRETDAEGEAENEVTGKCNGTTT